MMSLHSIQVALFVVLMADITGRFGVRSECPATVSKYMLKYGDIAKDTHAAEVTMNYTFNAFGKVYNGWRVKPMPAKGLGAYFVYPVGEAKRVFELRTSRIGYTETENTTSGFRVTESGRSLNKISKLINRAYPCVGRGLFTPKMAFVHTVTCAQFKDGADTFQTVFTTDEERTYMILIYSTLSGTRQAQFGIKHIPTGKNYGLTLDSIDRADVLLHETNGIYPGVWTYDVTDRVPDRPQACGKTRNECTATIDGAVTAFDNHHVNFNLDTSQQYSVLLSSTLPLDNPCNIMIYTRMDNVMHLSGLHIKLGVGPDNIFFRDFYLQNNGPFYVKGEDFRGRRRPSFPFTYTDGTTSVTLVQTSEGYLLTSTTCGYQVEYRPKGREPSVRVTVNDNYANILTGMCGNFDGEFQGL